MTHPTSESAWSLPVALADVPEAGRQFVLAADERTRAAIAKVAGVAALPRLGATFEVRRHGRNGLHVVGRVSATVGQNCVVTLEPIENEIEESIDLVFVPHTLPAGIGDLDVADIDVLADETPEPLVDGTVDLGAIASEFLILGIDPYPRKPDAVFEPPSAGDPGTHPFAALAALQKRQTPDDG